MKKLLSLALYATLLLNPQDLLASSREKIRIHDIKAGAGRPGDAAPDGTGPIVFNVPYNDSTDFKNWKSAKRTKGDPDDWEHFFGRGPALKMLSTLDIFKALQQRLLMLSFTKNGALKEPETNEDKLSFALSMMLKAMGERLQQEAERGIAQKIKAQKAKGADAEFVKASLSPHERYVHPTETFQVGHLFKASQNKRKPGKVILIVPGSKKARQTELDRAEKLVNEGYDVYVMDRVVSDDSTSTVANQLAQSVDACAFNVQLVHLKLQEAGYTNITWDANSVGSMYAMHALSPEMLAKMPPEYKPPSHVHLHDCPQPLVPQNFDPSLLDHTKITVSVAKDDDYTSKEHVDMWKTHLGNPRGIEVVTHPGYHDQSLSCDAAGQEEGLYYIPDAAVYSSLMVSMPDMHEHVQKALRDTIAAAGPGDIDFNAEAMNLYGRLMALDIKGNVFGDPNPAHSPHAPELFVHKASLKMIQKRLQSEKALVESYRGSLEGEVNDAYKSAEKDNIAAFKGLFVRHEGESFKDYNARRLEPSKELTRKIGLPTSDVFVENQHLLTHYVLRSDWFKDNYKRFSDMKFQRQEDERFDGLADLLDRLQLKVVRTGASKRTSSQLDKKIESLVKATDVAAQIKSFQKILGMDLNADVPDGFWIPMASVPTFLDLLPVGAIFGARTKEEAKVNETGIRTRMMAGFEEEE